MLYMTIQEHNSDGKHTINLRKLDGDDEGNGIAITIFSDNAKKQIDMTLESNEAHELGEWLVKHSASAWHVPQVGA